MYGIKLLGWFFACFMVSITSAADSTADNQSLFAAAEHGDIPALHALLQARAQVNCTNRYGQTPLMIAAQENYREAHPDNHGKYIEFMKLLLQAGAAVNAIDRDGFTPLIEAHTPEFVQLLLEAKAAVNQCDLDGLTPLMCAIPDVARMRLLLDAKAAVDGMYNGETPLFMALNYRDSDAVQLLLESGAHPSLPDTEGITPLIKSVVEPTDSCWQPLIAAGASLDAQDKHQKTAVIHAAEHGNHKALTDLIKAGAAVDILDNRDTTALIYATQKRHVKCVQALLLAQASLFGIPDDYSDDENIAKLLKWARAENFEKLQQWKSR